MPIPGNINLLKTETTLSPEVIALVAQLRKISIAAVAIALAAGVIVGVVYSAVGVRYSLLTNNKKQLTAAINSQSQKEGMLLALKARTEAALRIQSELRVWVSFLDSLERIAVPPQMRQVMVDESGRAVVSYTFSSLEEAAIATATVLQLTEERLLRVPQLVSFSLDSEGGVRLVFSFFPVI